MDRKLSEMDKQVNKILEQEWIKEIDKILKHIYQGYQVTKTGKIITTLFSITLSSSLKNL